MSDIVRLTASQVDVDSNNAETNAATFVVSAEFTKTHEDNFTLAASGIWQALSFGMVTTATYVRLKSDQPLSIKMNGSTTAIANVYDFICTGAITALQVLNNSGNTANISWEAKG